MFYNRLLSASKFAVICGKASSRARARSTKIDL